MAASLDAAWQRDRHQEFIRLLNAVEREVPAGKSVHAIVDPAVHRHPKVRASLARHKRWTFHFTPTSASWLNAVKGFLRRLTKRWLKPGAFCSIVELVGRHQPVPRKSQRESTPLPVDQDPNKIIAAVDEAPSVRFGLLVRSGADGVALSKKIGGTKLLPRSPSVHTNIAVAPIIWYPADA
jgi:hypothetical protein